MSGNIISRDTLLWLLIVNLAVLLPLYEKFIPWTMAICAICFVWRIGIYFGKLAKPPRYLVTILALGSALTLALVSKQIGTLPALINLLILGYALKFIEMHNHRDVKAVVIAGYFLIALTFIDQQTIFIALLLMLLTIANTSVLVSLYFNKQPLVTTLKFTSKLIALSLPLAALMFIIIPRLPPLWMVPQLNTAQTGLSNTLNFGDIDQLTQSSELAFRAIFEQQPPKNAQLYWRALVLENYDGKTWSQTEATKKLEQLSVSRGNAYIHPRIKDRKSEIDSIQSKKASDQAINYSIIAQPSNKRWLFGLDTAYSSDTRVNNLADFRLLANKPLSQKFYYQVNSYPNEKRDLTLTPQLRATNLSLPKTIDFQLSNPKTRAAAEQYRLSYSAPKARVQAMMRHFNQQAFYYTLRPPRLGNHQIDDFLFKTQAGYCTHYASALVFLARASGIPARLVTGYQGGEWNPNANYMSIYQYMAHAWTEIWFEGEGWVKFDPTAMIAPERILSGFDAQFDPQESYLRANPFSTLRLKQYPFFNQLRQTFASIDFYWSIWVLGFNEKSQTQLLENLLGQLTKKKLIITVLLSLLAILLFIGYYAGLFQFRARKKDPLVTLYNQICQQLANKGCQKDLHEGPIDFAKRVEQKYPHLSQEFTQFTTLYIQLKYQPIAKQLSIKVQRHFSHLVTSLKRQIDKIPQE